MPYEILNFGQATPHRLHALAKLIVRMPGIDRQTALDMVAPKELDEKQPAANTVFDAAKECHLIAPHPESSDALVSTVDASVEGFREHMRGVILGVTDDAHNNFLFNQYAAWYATQDERVLSMGIDEYHTQFNAQMHADSEERAFNRTKRYGWETWGAFLGLGWPLSLTGRREVFVPDARGRVGALLPTLLPGDRYAVPFAEFATRLADACPELDGGVLFERAWEASRATARSNQLSLQLSNALRGLHETGRIELLNIADASDTWTLFPASGFEVQRVSHIRVGAAL